MPDLTYNPNEREHVNFADTLGTLQGRVAKGTVNKSTANAYYIGVELLAKYPGSKSGGEYFLKMDATGHGSGSSERSKNRLIVKVNSAGGLIEGEAWVWRHDNRIEKLGSGFFTRAKMLRGMV
ncbi:hypothetical protein [Tabrizicola sp.]|jgi:hypothetical protein|uniref:hypothetical protein n=1 Tax=Tabrizicola sp. TaxID=2005166 RepID=UPI0035B20491